MSPVRFESTQGRLVIAAAVLGSGIAFLDSSVVNTALPEIRRNFHSTLAGQQWIVTGYLLTLGSLLVVGGSLGDIYGRRRMFVLGLVGFAATSMMCGLAPNLGVLITARVLQGLSAALLVPGSLAMLSAVFHPDDRARAIGSWSGLSGVTTAIGPFVGGWLIDSVSWRWIFLINLPLAGLAVYLAQRAVPETRGALTNTKIDVPGAVTLSSGLAGIVYALIEGPSNGWPAASIAGAVIGILMIATFVTIELRAPNPMVPPSMFKSSRFSGVNAATFLIWGAIGAVFFLLTLRLQNDLEYSALEAGASTLPVTALMLVLSARSGALAQRIGPRLQMTAGPLVVGAAFVLLGQVRTDSSYVAGVFPGVVLFGLGLAITVAPLTAAALSAVEDSRAGVGSAINNAVARIASLLAIAVLPALAGIATNEVGLGSGFAKAMWICAGFSVTGAAICFATIRSEHHNHANI